MATWADVRRLALALPETSERSSRGSLQWVVHDKLFVWERPLRRADIAALGAQVPGGPIPGARRADPGRPRGARRHEGRAMCRPPEVFFTTPHFDGYPAVLVRLERIALAELEELAVGAWLSRAPQRLVTAYLARRSATTAA